MGRRLARLRGVGFEPTQISLRELESRALTTRPSSLKGYRIHVQLIRVPCCTNPWVLQDVGFEPTRIAAPRPQRGPVTTWVILRQSDSSNNKAYYVGLLDGVLVG